MDVWIAKWRDGWWAAVPKVPSSRPQINPLILIHKGASRRHVHNPIDVAKLQLLIPGVKGHSKSSTDIFLT